MVDAMKASPSKHLSRDRWIDAAVAVLAEAGIDAVRVESLARGLHVTKGSFYWHFRDREDLLNATLRRWEKTETVGIMDQVEAAGGSAKARLRRLFAIALERGLVKLEVALRQWARRDARARKAIQRVDTRRLDYLCVLFEELGLPRPHAEARAFVSYAILFGDFFITVPRSSTQRATLLTHTTAFVLAPP